MAISTVNIGSAPNDGTGDPLRTAFNKLNTNFLNITADGGDEITVTDPTTSTDGTLNDALANIYASGGTPNLNEVTAEGGYTAQSIEIDVSEGAILNFSSGEGNVIGSIYNLGGEFIFYDVINGAQANLKLDSLTAPRAYDLPDKDGTFAMLDDVTGGGYTVVSSNQTAVNDTNYTVVANATFTDPSPTEGKGYVVYVRNGTATIGGTGYAVGSLVFRVFHSGAWSTREYKSNLTIDATPTNGSANAVQSDGVFDALALKLNLNRFVSQTKTSITGVTGESNICSFKIDGGAYASTDGFKFDFTQYKGTTGSTITYRAYIGTTSGARTNQILASAITGANRTGDVTRRYYIDGGNLDCGVPFTTNAQSGLSGFSTVNTPISVNMANDLWITITAQGQTSGETVGILGASITPLK